MVVNTLGRYFAGRFVTVTVTVFVSIFLLVVFVDYIELMRRTANNSSASALFVAQTSLFRVPQLLERLMPFCILIGAMTCYLDLSRRLELVIARAAGISAWQFLSPALAAALFIGALATSVYNPMAADMQERAIRMEAVLFGEGRNDPNANFWANQISSEGQAILSAAASQNQGTLLSGLTVYRFSPTGEFQDRIEAREAALEPGRWRLKNARRYTLDSPPEQFDTFILPTNLTPAQVRNSFSTAESVSFWQLPEYIRSSQASGLATARYQLQYQKLLAQPFLLTAMVLLAGAVSLRFFRFGGVQKMVLSGVAAGFLLYVLSKVTEDLSKAELLNPVAAAWLPAIVGGLSGFMALLYQEDG